MRYDLLSAHSSTELLDKVNEALKQGWTPLGGASATTLTGEPYFIQAMIRMNEVSEADAANERAAFVRIFG
jgi:Domain of unknown function (DUF1737)